MGKDKKSLGGWLVAAIAILILFACIRFFAVKTVGSVVRRDMAVATLNGGDAAWVAQQAAESGNSVISSVCDWGILVSIVGAILVIGLMVGKKLPDSLSDDDED
jgi:hypothetical protein